MKAAQYMAVNHNGNPLMLKPASKAEAQRELAMYILVTGNSGAVVPYGNPTKASTKARNVKSA